MCPESPGIRPRPKAIVSWSTGKDGAYALHTVRSLGGLEVVGLITTVTRAYDRVSMHGVRVELLREQASSVGLPLSIVEIPSPCPNDVYERAMGGAMEHWKELGVSHVVFGDLFLEEIRKYREQRLSGAGMTGVFPLWGRPTSALAGEMIDAGLKATLVCVDPRKLDASFAGRSFDRELLGLLPNGVDPLGENGEFHTFVTDGPGFARPIAVREGERVTRDGFVFADLVPVEPSNSL
ncbi:MAG: adenine nucleotide alpha hydrolase [Thermoplasmata archaeon]|nr:adenine nucleotide alpha hydrolase [Thermoplasmata archaeon]